MATLNGNYREYTLDNGLHVALQNTPTQTISGRLRIHHGALHEQEGEEGIAHFLEHMIMRGGGKKYSPNDALRIMGTFGSINAHTRLSDTSIPVGMLAEDVEQYVDFISDIVFHPRLEENILSQERQRVLREITDNKSNSANNDQREFQNALYGIDSPYAYYTAGQENVVANAAIDNLREFHQRGYSPNNMDLILVGCLPKNMEEIINKYFADKPKGSGQKYIFPKNQELNERMIIHKPHKGMYNHQNPEQSSAYICIGFPASIPGADDEYATASLVDVLGGDANSRLFQRVSQQMGLAYGIRSDFMRQYNSGTINICGNISAMELGKVEDAIFEEMNLLKKELVDPKEISRLNRKNRYGLAKYFETNEGHVYAIESKWDMGYTPEIVLEKIHAVTPEMVRDAANKYFPSDRQNGKYVLLLLDPFKE